MLALPRLKPRLPKYLPITGGKKMGESLSRENYHKKHRLRFELESTVPCSKSVTVRVSTPHTRWLYVKKKKNKQEASPSEGTSQNMIQLRRHSPVRAPQALILLGKWVGTVWNVCFMNLIACFFFCFLFFTFTIQVSQDGKKKIDVENLNISCLEIEKKNKKNSRIL